MNVDCSQFQPDPSEVKLSRAGSRSVAFKLDGVDGGGDGAAAVAPPLLFRLFVAERFAFGEPQHLVGFLAPVPIGAALEMQEEDA